MQRPISPKVISLTEYRHIRNFESSMAYRGREPIDKMLCDSSSEKSQLTRNLLQLQRKIEALSLTSEWPQRNS